MARRNVDNTYKHINRNKRNEGGGYKHNTKTTIYVSIPKEGQDAKHNLYHKKLS